MNIKLKHNKFLWIGFKYVLYHNIKSKVTFLKEITQKQWQNVKEIATSILL